MVRFIKNSGLVLHIITNGVNLDSTLMKELMSAGLTSADHIMFSILANSAALHEQIMKGVSHDCVVGNITALLEHRKKSGANGPVIEVICYAIKENCREIDDFLNHWRGRVDHARISGRISEHFAKKHTGETTSFERTDTCPNIWERLTVFWNGDVTICCADLDGDYVIGNLASQSIREIWNCQKLDEVRKLHQKKQFHSIPICQRCDM